MTDDRAERLKWAREKAEFDSPRAAARHFRWNENTYKAREAGLRDYGPEDAIIYGRAFAVWWGWLLTGQGSPEPRNVVPVVGRVGAGGRIEPPESKVPEGGLFEIEVSFSVPEDVVAFECADEGSWPRYEPGDMILCRTVGADAEAVIDQEAAVRTVEGERYLRRISRGAQRGTYDLEAYNGRPMRNVRLDWTGPVEAVVRRGRWVKIDAGALEPPPVPRLRAAE
jgi:hypothetical protein